MMCQILAMLAEHASQCKLWRCKAWTTVQPLVFHHMQPEKVRVEVKVNFTFCLRSMRNLLRLASKLFLFIHHPISPDTAKLHTT